jgi:G:T-mismatch repair DNA endonuclease (very short patch repair protein)
VIHVPTKGQLSGYLIQCENCGKEVYKTKTQYNKSKHHFCSNKCQKEFEHKEKYEDRKCEVCCELFHVRKKYAQRFCSTECQNVWQTQQTGIKNPKFTRELVICDCCGDEFYMQNYRMGLFEHKFCSDKCRKKWYSEVFSQDENWKEESRKRAVRILENKQIDTNTKPQQIINDLLENMGISYINEKGFKYYAVDNYLSDYNLIIEVMGDFWHCHPLKYNKENMKDIHKKRIPKDKAKHTYFKNKYNIEILYLWEDDIYNNLDVCRSLIDKYINNKGILENYHSFNYYLKDGNLFLDSNIIIPYQDAVNA